MFNQSNDTIDSEDKRDKNPEVNAIQDFKNCEIKTINKGNPY